MIGITGPEICISQDWIAKNNELTINTKFAEALDLLKSQKVEYSDIHKIYFYSAATLNSKMIHFENFDDESEFNKYIDSTISVIEPRLEQIDPNDTSRAQLLFYLGSAYGYRGYFEGRKGNWYSAMSNGLEAKSLLYEAIEVDSTLYEAYLGIGTYKYWLSSKIKFIVWLPLIPDDREEGIQMIKKSMQSNGPTRFMAMHQLIYVLLDFGNFDEAQKYAEEIVTVYPESQFMWWANAHTYYKKREYEKAISAYNQLINLFNNDPGHNPAHMIKCNLKLAQLYFELEEYSQCISHSRMILDKKNDKVLYELTKNEFAEAEEYLDLSLEKSKNSSIN